MTLTITDTRLMLDTLVHYHSVLPIDFYEVEAEAEMLTASLPEEFADAISDWVEYWNNSLHYKFRDEARAAQPGDSVHEEYEEYASEEWHEWNKDD